MKTLQGSQGSIGLITTFEPCEGSRAHTPRRGLSLSPEPTAGLFAGELEIVWLNPRERYDYLRESIDGFPQRKVFPRRRQPTRRNTDGGPGTHLVAYAVLKPDAPSFNGVFMRRYWWVKTYDRWEGHGTDRGTFYDKGGPVEAVVTSSVKAGEPSTPGWP